MAFSRGLISSCDRGCGVTSTAKTGGSPASSCRIKCPLSYGGVSFLLVKIMFLRILHVCEMLLISCKISF